MDLHFISIPFSFLSSEMHLISTAFSDVYNWVRNAALENISPFPAVAILAVIVLLATAWLYCDRFLVHGRREEIKDFAAGGRRRQDPD